MADLAPEIFAAHWMRQLGAGEYLYLDEPRLADVRPLPLDRAEVFLAVEIQHQRFYGVACGEGLFLDHEWHLGRRLGVAVITTIRGNVTAANEMSASDRNWVMGNQPADGQLSVSGPMSLSDRGRQALAYTFGLPVLPLLPSAIRHKVDPADFFYRSPAFAALRGWAARQACDALPAAPADDPLDDWTMAALAVGQTQVGFPERAPTRAQSAARR